MSKTRKLTRKLPRKLPRKLTRTLTRTLSTKISPEMYDEFEILMREHDLTVSQFIRHLIFNQILEKQIRQESQRKAEKIAGYFKRT